MQHASAREELRRFSFWPIKSVKSPDGGVLSLNHDMCDAFRAHFRDRFARCPDFSVQEFRSYLANFSRLREAEAADCEGLVTDCELRDALKQGWPQHIARIDGLPE